MSQFSRKVSVEVRIWGVFFLFLKFRQCEHTSYLSPAMTVKFSHRTDMRNVPGLGSYVGIKLGAYLLKRCLSISIVFLDQEYDCMVSEVKLLYETEVKLLYETEIQPPI